MHLVPDPDQAVAADALPQTCDRVVDAGVREVDKPDHAGDRVGAGRDLEELNRFLNLRARFNDDGCCDVEGGDCLLEVVHTERAVIALVWQRGFSSIGATERELHGFKVWIASPEKLLADGAARPSRMGGLPGLVRVLDRAQDSVDWQQLVELSANIPRGRQALKRLAHLLTLIAVEVPPPLDTAAAARPGEHPILLGEKRLYGGGGERDQRYGLIRNIDARTLNEEVWR